MIRLIKLLVNRMGYTLVKCANRMQDNGLIVRRKFYGMKCEFLGWCERFNDQKTIFSESHFDACWVTIPRRDGYTGSNGDGCV